MKRLCCLAALLAVCLGANAQDYAGRTIESVQVEGLERIGEQLVLSQLEVAPGQEYNPRAIARDIRRLYDLGYFSVIKADARLEGEGVVLTYVVEEKRLIDEILIVGNRKVRDRHIRAELTWREGDSFVAQAYEEERDAILALYQAKGFPNASVDIVAEEIGPSRVRLTYIINEGKKARIKHIRFVGNEVLSKRQLKKVMDTSRSWWIFGGRYNEDQFEDDLDNIVSEYADYGRLEAEVAKTDFEYYPNGKGLDITIYLEEGPEYTVETIEIADNIVFDDDEVMDLLEVQAGDVHNRSQIIEDAGLVGKGYSDSGYVRAEVVPQVTLDREAKQTHIVYRIAEGDLKYVRQVRITGNNVTRDEVLRRQILTIPGERFDGTLLEASKRRLEALEYFEEGSPRFNLEDVLEDDRYADLLVDVEEGKTSFWNFGLGYSTEEAFSVYNELRFRNFDIGNPPGFSGGGQQLRLRTSLGQRRTQYSLAFTDPEFLGRPLAFGFDVFDESYDYGGGTDYTEDTQGVQLRLGKVLSPFVNARTALRYRKVSIMDTQFQWLSAYEEFIGGETTVSSIWGINRSNLDSKRDPSSGATHDLELEIAGLGGDNDFIKVQHDSSWYWALDEKKKWVLNYRTREGWSSSYGDDRVPLTDRFFAGGASTVRGYEHRDIGPQKKRYTFFGDDVRVGGELRFINNLELKYKITDIFRIYTFTDAGGVWLDTSDFGFDDMRYSVGLGLGIDVPRMGPIRVDYGYPINPDDDQGGGRLHLMTGFRF